MFLEFAQSSLPTSITPISAAVDLAKQAIPTFGLIAVAWIQFRKHAGKVDCVDDKIGQPNGKGNVVEMLEKILLTTDALADRMAHVEEYLGIEPPKEDQ